MVGEDAAQFLLLERALVDELQIVDEDALLVDLRRPRRHRSRRDAADIGVVAAGSDVEEDCLLRVVEHRRHHRDIRQMRAAIIRRVEREDVAGADIPLVLRDDRLDRAVHGAEMHRHVRRVGDEGAGVVEDGAGKVQPFLDVDRGGGVLQRHAHLLGDRHEEVVEDFEQHGIGALATGRTGAESGEARLLLDALQEDVVLRRRLGRPAGLDDDGLVRLDDQRRPLHRPAGSEVFAADDRRLARLAAGEEAAGFGRPSIGRSCCGGCAGGSLLRPLRGLDRHRLDGDRPARIDEAELRLVGRLEAFAGVFQRTRIGHRQRRVGPVVAQLEQHFGDVLARLHPLRLDLAGGLAGKPLGQRLDLGLRLLRQIGDQRLRPAGEQRGEADAIGREEARHRMDQHALHRQRIGDEAGMLAAGAAEGVEQIFRDVVATLHRDLLDGVGHVLDGDGQEPLGDLFRRAAVAELLGEFGEFLAHHRDVQRLVLVRPEHRGEEFRLQLAEHDIGIGDGQRPAAAIGGGAGIGTGRRRADLETPLVDGQDRAAAGRHRVDAQHRRADADARDFRIQRPLVGAGIVRHVGGRAAHVEADDLGKARRLRRLGHADDAAGGTGKDRVLALEHLGRRQSARRHHELQRRRVGIAGLGAKGAGDLVDIAPEDRRQIGVDHRGVAAPDQLDQRRDLVAHRDLREAGGLRQLFGPRLVLAIVPGMHEDDGDGVDALGLGCLERGLRRRLVERHLDRAVGEHPLRHLGNSGIELFGQDDLFREDVRPGLIGDLQRVAETAGDEQQRLVALALQKRVGRHRRSHPHRADAAGRDGAAGLDPERLADPLQRRVVIDAGVFGQQLPRMQGSVRRLADDVGEGAAAIDEEVPAPVASGSGCGVRLGFCMHGGHLLVGRTVVGRIFVDNLSVCYQRI